MCLNRALNWSLDRWKNQLITWIIDLLNFHDRNFITIIIKLFRSQNQEKFHKLSNCVLKWDFPVTCKPLKRHINFSTLNCKCNYECFILIIALFIHLPCSLPKSLYHFKQLQKLFKDKTCKINKKHKDVFLLGIFIPPFFLSCF